MNYEAFAFFNQQLAGMLRDGIPLEGSLKQLSSGMRGRLRLEIELLEADLAKGMLLNEALARRELPEFYKRMVEIGARSNDLPGVLTMVADHYHKSHALWTRLKGLMVYPFIVLVASLTLAVGLSILFSRVLSESDSLFYSPMGAAHVRFNTTVLWFSPAVLFVLTLAAGLVVLLPGCRAWLRWNVPALRDASLAQLASAMSLMLKQGTTLDEALVLAEALESATPAGKAMLAKWRGLVESGQGKPVSWPGDSRPFPRLFLWFVQRSGEDIAAGFQKASEFYQARALYRSELLLYGALPVSVLFLGIMLAGQLVPAVRALTSVMNAIGE
jgi:type IV pilus assembly protein PilC